MTTADAPPADTESLEALVRQRLAGRAHVRGLRVVVRDQGIILEGRATCYYAKRPARGDGGHRAAAPGQPNRGVFRGRG
jgi:hypothetical protein